MRYDEEGATFHTIFEDYKISYAEIEEAKNAKNEDGGNRYSAGDTDMIVFELGIEKLRSDIKDGKYLVSKGDSYDWNLWEMSLPLKYKISSNDTISGGFAHELWYYLTGKKSETANLKASKEDLLNRFMNNPDNSAVACSFGILPAQKEVNDANGNTVELYGDHEYSIKSYDGDNVIIVNPWDSGEDITVSKEDFLNNSDTVSYADLSHYARDFELLIPKMQAFIKEHKNEE